MTTTIILLIITSIFNIIDYCQTAYAIGLFGLGVELNPIGRLMFAADCGWLKLIIMPILLLALGLIIKADKRLSWEAWLVTILYLIVIINNFYMLIRAGVFFF